MAHSWISKNSNLVNFCLSAGHIANQSVIYSMDNMMHYTSSVEYVSLFIVPAADGYIQDMKFTRNLDISCVIRRHY